jgi:hypothetical protein
VSKNRVVVLEQVDGFYHVLDSDGNFRRVRSRVKAEVGEEIEVAAFKINRTAKVLLSIVAIFLLTILSTLGWSSWQTPVVVATLSVDINPSLELALDKEKHIVNVRAKNDDAQKLLQGFNFKGQTLTQALNQLITRAIELNYVNEERKLIVLGFSQGTEETSESDEKITGLTDLAEVDSQALLSGLNEVAASKGLDLEVVIFKLNSREGSEAQKTGLSLGEYALWETAEKAGVAVTKQTVKNSKERSHLIEVPAVQNKIKQNLHVIKSKTSADQSKQKTLKASKSNKGKEKK